MYNENFLDQAVSEIFLEGQKCIQELFVPPEDFGKKE